MVADDNKACTIDTLLAVNDKEEPKNVGDILRKEEVDQAGEKYETCRSLSPFMNTVDSPPL